MEKTRISFWDIAKGVTMILIVWGHAGAGVGGGGVGTAIVQFHMPLFFIVSGYFFSDKTDFRSFCKKKFMTLLCPYFIYSFAYLLLSAAKDILSGEAIDFVLKTSMMQLFYISGEVVNIGRPLWFLPVLFFAECIYKAWCCVPMKPARYIGSGMLTLLAFTVLPTLPFGLTISCVALIFYAIGDAIKKVPFDRLDRKYSLGVGIALLVVEYFVAQLNEGVNLYRLSYGSSWALYILSALLGSTGMILICLVINKCFALEYFGRNTLAILATHFVLLMVLRPLLGMIISDEVFYFGMILTVLCLIIEVPIIEIVNRSFPILNGKIKKSKGDVNNVQAEHSGSNLQC